MSFEFLTYCSTKANSKDLDGYLQEKGERTPPKGKNAQSPSQAMNGLCLKNGYRNDHNDNVDDDDDDEGFCGRCRITRCLRHGWIFGKHTES